MAPVQYSMATSRADVVSITIPPRIGVMNPNATTFMPRNHSTGSRNSASWNAWPVLRTSPAMRPTTTAADSSNQLERWRTTLRSSPRTRLGKLGTTAVELIGYLRSSG